MVARSGASLGSRPPDNPGEIPSLVVRTRDPDKLADELAPVAAGVRFEATAAGGLAAEVRAWRLPRVGLVGFEFDHGRALFGEERDFVALTVPLAGRLEFRLGRRVEECVPGEVHVSPAHEPFDCRTAPRSRFLAASLDDGLVRSHARALGGDGRARAIHSSRLVSSNAKCASFFRYLRWLSQESQREGSALAVPLVASEAEVLLAALLVEACWPPGAAREKGARAALRRAEEFLVARLETAVSLPEVAAAAGVSIRTLTRAFHRKHGFGPIGFLRRCRLQAARRDLLAAEPGYESVTQVALRYGFAHLGRFAGEYSKAFRESPSETLRR
jgi:AraC-like DNA-binding protein